MITKFFFENTQHLYATLFGVSIVFLLALLFFIISTTKKKQKRKTIEAAAQYVLLQVIQTSHTETQPSGVEEVRLFEDLLTSIIPEKSRLLLKLLSPMKRQTYGSLSPHHLNMLKLFATKCDVFLNEHR